ncbi:NUDIX hydrolase [Paraliobacillus ryukyuensis]|uniref:NUDIX hydrolase n=1 Tax=Paraliobacillus ryukyuensis TaxID=200904 RepID=UPI0009A60FAF|nr:NUDIX domain-containing protein [Paraliobacillus ryukyuensis]
MLSQDLSIDLNEGKLNIRVAAWIEYNGKLLVCQFPDGARSLPGGRMQYGETSEEAIKREIFEETGVALVHTKLFAVIENFFQYKQGFHELLFIYKGEIPFQSDYRGRDADDQVIAWTSLDNVSELKPSVLVNLKNQMAKETILHLVSVDDSIGK